MRTIFKFNLLLLFLILLIPSQYTFSQKMIKVIPEDGSIQPFLIDEREVTMQDFEGFVQETNHKTTCEVLGFGGIYSKEGENVKTENINWRHDPYGIIIDKKEYDNLPVARVSIIDMQAFAKWKNKRMPTVEEWILAANSGKQKQPFKYAGSNNLNKVGWFDKDVKMENQGFFAVMQKMPTDLGIYDMSGNAEELTCISKSCDTITRKGGRYISDQSMSRVNEDYSMKITNKNFNSPFVGFRLVKDVN